MREGVIQFSSQHQERALRPEEGRAARVLFGWRSILHDTSLLGAEPDRYGGLGFGNISARFGARSSPRGQRPFVVSGSQTSQLEEVCVDDFAAVREWSVSDNRVCSAGRTLPSSESLTHATIYDEGPHLQIVLHVHSPHIWREHRTLNLPATPAEVGYGTVAMAEATRELFRAGRVQECQVFVMLGHEDGVVAFGRTVDEAGSTLMRTLALARSATRRQRP